MPAGRGVPALLGLHFDFPSGTITGGYGEDRKKADQNTRTGASGGPRRPLDQLAIRGRILPLATLNLTGAGLPGPYRICVSVSIWPRAIARPGEAFSPPESLRFDMPAGP